MISRPPVPRYGPLDTALARLLRMRAFDDFTSFTLTLSSPGPRPGRIEGPALSLTKGAGAAVSR